MEMIRVKKDCVFFFFQAEDGIRIPLGSRGLGDVYRSQGRVLDKMPRARVTEALVTAARTDGARRAIDAGARRIVVRVRDRPIGKPARWLPPNGPRRLEAALALSSSHLRPCRRGAPPPRGRTKQRQSRQPALLEAQRKGPAL